MERHGWRAIIYDVEWAKFLSGQTGVYVSEDGRSCETVDDDKSNIIVVVDHNFSFSDRTTGHILFRQKGSNLYDIVCINQEAGGTYEIDVDDIEINVCTSYNDFIDKLKVYEVINGERKELTSEEVRLSGILTKPTEDDFAKYSDITEETTTNIIVEKNGAYGSATLTILPSDARVQEYDRTEISSTDTISMIKEKDGTFTYNIVPSTSIKCNGGEVKFSVDKNSTVSPLYKIILSGVTAIEYYNIIECNNIVGQSTKEGKIEFDVVKKEGVSIKEKGGDYIELFIADGVNYVEINIKCNEAEKNNISVTKP